MIGPARRTLVAALVLAIGVAVISGSDAKKQTDAPTDRTTGRFPALEEVERDIERLIETVRPSVVSIIAVGRLEDLLEGSGYEVRILESLPGGVARRVGSGVVIDESGHIATVSMVVRNATEITVIPADGRKLSARIKGIDGMSGVAVLALDDAEGLLPARLAEPGDVDPGSLVTAFGNPEHGGPSYSIGFVSGTGVSEGPARSGNYLRLNAYIAPGAAGGPVFDSKGRLVGIVFGARGEQGTAVKWDFKTGDGEDTFMSVILDSLHRQGSEAGGAVGYAVPVDTLRYVTRQIIETGEVRRGWLGVTIESPEPREVFLRRVVAGSPADLAGLAVGDRVIAVEGAPLLAAEALVGHIAAMQPGETLSLQVLRGAERLDFSIELADRDDVSTRTRSRQVLRNVWISRPRLGVRVETPDPETRRRWSIPADVGLLVLEVTHGSRAQRAGLSPGDVMVEILGEPVRGVSDLRRAIRSQGQERNMDIRVVRGGRAVTLLVPPDPAPAPMPAPPAPPPPPEPYKD